MSYIYNLLNRIERTPSLYLITILFVLTFLVYGNALFNGFVWDDEEAIVKNTTIQRILNIPFLFTENSFYSGGAGGLSGFYYKPLMSVAFSINFALWKDNPFGFHLFDIFIHTINGVLVFFLFKKLLSLGKNLYPQTISFALALTFLLHPANTESVVYISSTQELLYTFFLLTSLLLVLRVYKKQQLSIKTLSFLNLIILLSLLSKESGVVVIPITLSFFYIFNRTRFALMATSTFLTFFVYLILRFFVAKTPLFGSFTSVPIANASLIERFLTIPYELFSYFRLLFFPKDLFISQHAVVSSFLDPRFYLAAPVVIAVIVLFILLGFRTKSKLYIFFLLWLVFSFSILLNIYPLDMTIAERWLYGPMIGFLGSIGVLMSHSINRSKKAAVFLFIIFMATLPFFAFRTFLRTFDWKDSFSLFSHDIQYAPGSFDLQNNLGVALFRNGNYKEAKKYFERSIALSPKWWISYNNLGVIYQREENVGKAKELYEKSIKNGDYYLAYENLAALKFKTEQPNDVIPFLEQALLKLPSNELLNKIATLLYYKTGATDSAKFYAEKAYLINPSQENYFLLQQILKN